MPPILYIELKTGYADNGPAWIGRVTYSKSGRMVYFDGKALQRMNGPSGGANHYDVETGEGYWVSGVKKNGQDRHWAGGGKIMVDKTAVELYLSMVDFDSLDESKYMLVDIKPTDKSHFNAILNAPLQDESE